MSCQEVIETNEKSKEKKSSERERERKKWQINCAIMKYYKIVFIFSYGIKVNL